MNLECQIIHWIGEGVTNACAIETVPVIPVQRLVRRLPTYRRTQDPSLTDSMIISFETFDQATIYRTIRHLQMRGFVELIEDRNEDSGCPTHYITLSSEGLSELARLRSNSKR